MANYTPLGRSYIHPITVLLHTGEHINDTVIVAEYLIFISIYLY